MSLDIKYRPYRYSDVLGQDATITILKQYVVQGRGFRQSYLFCGERGRGKTTVGRILARALLCENTRDGEPCDECHSCKGLLENGTSLDFMEVDAATHSGKGDVNKIKEEIQYSTFSGKRRIYLFDEAHQLSKDALDALLKPLEDTMPGSEDKQLTCIFCTTEPERMRATVLSRCAPAFVIQPMQPQLIADRLQHICEQEQISFEPEMLTLVAEITECHIRDALKAIEGVSMLGGVTREHVEKYLHLDLNTAYLDLLDAIGNDLPAAFEAARRIMDRASPATCYDRLAEVSMLAFQASLGEAVPAHWGKERLVALGAARGAQLLGYASRFAARPGRPTAAMLMMDLAHLHHVGGSVRDPVAVLQVQATGASASAPAPSVQPPTPRKTPEEAGAAHAAPRSSVPNMQGSSPEPGMVPDQDAAWVAAERGPASIKRDLSVVGNRSKSSSVITPANFAQMLHQTILDLDQEFGDGGSS